jgi:hypothetical protein
MRQAHPTAPTRLLSLRPDRTGAAPLLHHTALQPTEAGISIADGTFSQAFALPGLLMHH